MIKKEASDSFGCRCEDLSPVVDGPFSSWSPPWSVSPFLRPLPRGGGDIPSDDFWPNTSIWDTVNPDQLERSARIRLSDNKELRWRKGLMGLSVLPLAFKPFCFFFHRKLKTQHKLISQTRPLFALDVISIHHAEIWDDNCSSLLSIVYFREVQLDFRMIINFRCIIAPLISKFSLLVANSLYESPIIIFQWLGVGHVLSAASRANSIWVWHHTVRFASKTFLKLFWKPMSQPQLTKRTERSKSW